ncbi:hypothetical protein ACNY4O_003607 [Cronobacter sakazakii]|uniref:hypothetical protein n=1 Tax=Cronobacter sakazakii TaxID=28141 RepID=UPI001EF86822|nr:hypothetical protein [Cronobacter sakazakii]MDK1304498.1 hypothetical protein [Cronobacter sakazakii]
MPVHRATRHLRSLRDLRKRGMRDTALSERKDGGIDELLTRLKRLLFGSPGHKSPCLFLAGGQIK